jgi:hypothetical protein
MDGWLSHGFHSHDLSHLTTLDIRGYARDGQPGTRRWWKFDLPPGWFELRARPLEEVCAAQWLQANAHILRDRSAGLLEDPLVVHYEGLLDPNALARELGRILAFAELGGTLAASARPTQSVMAVTPPQPRKWRKRVDALTPIITSAPIAEMAATLGYDPHDWQRWP